jgi:hypothetical protein
MSKQRAGKAPTRSFGGTMVAVVWSFIGLRRRSDFDQDVGGLNPLYVIVAGFLGTALFIAGLIMIVNLVVK